MAKILVIDDDRSICESLELYLSEEGYEVHTAVTGTDGLNKFVQVQPDLVILDIRLPDIDGFTVLEELREDDEDVKVIMITAFHDMDTTIRAMKAGAYDYIHKPINIDELEVSLQKALKTLETEKKIGGLLTEPSRDYKVGDIIGSTRAMRDIFKTIGVVSQSRATVLIQGESGTGKELIAKVIHNNTAKNEPYIAVNCSPMRWESTASRGAVSMRMTPFWPSMTTIITMLVTTALVVDRPTEVAPAPVARPRSHPMSAIVNPKTAPLRTSTDGSVRAAWARIFSAAGIMW